ncbi:MAG: pseudouridine-5'-phosphate glycosidase [Candidatus Dadabacteria bacterium]|nr:MAG: pseudouridine-5'-phosphate glycosidase [Candidatus Dadabacteria bacterium]
MEIAHAVRESLASGRPVVALETAVLTHGLPRPANREVYAQMCDAVRGAGAVPAPVGVVDGRIRVGLTPAEIGRLAEAGAEKAGLADLPVVAARRSSAGTTVAATLWAAHRAGVRVFATGGIGGVHRGWNRLPDVSGDIPALARFPLCVVCSGAKVVLDLAATREALETAGVPVIGYRTDRFPAFVCADAGFPVRHRAEEPDEVAEVVRCRDACGLPAAVLVVNPPPASHAVARDEVERALAGRPESEGGGEVTPRLLARLAEATGGASLAANRALLVANAALAAEVARCLAGA